MPRKTGPLLTDIARIAGVSPATVDRVLNRRPGVREATARRVLRAAADTGYLDEAEIGAALRPRPLRLVFLLPAGTNPYLRLLGDTAKRLAANPGDANATVRCFFIDSFNPEALAEALLRHGEKASGVAFMAIDHPLVREAVNALVAKGKQVVTLVSDISNAARTAYVGLDNRSVGRTAAHLMGRFVGRGGGSVALIAASRTYRAHEEREMGFLGLMEEDFPGLRVVGVREGHDDRDENYRHTLRLIAEYPDLVGIYNVGGSSDGIARALREKGRGTEVVFIGHGLTPDTRRNLVEGVMDVVLTQSPELVALNAMQIIRNAAEGSAAEAGVPRLAIEVVVKENLP
ncbi:LacI family DNA-binding transcriptional regulator [Acidimangrovimonas sediminis]|uniref:LacI family DNA-binding transcriptional regulator n=1 Tax=Acidimangrovimonas sediminis TaxID=2056283 RepID=UPI000C7FD4E1|nr:LacI family DNA-binding transcriptional regulator [Acidimangrovimonas sediminis]